MKERKRNLRKESRTKWLPPLLTLRKPCDAIPLPRIAGVNLARLLLEGGQPHQAKAAMNRAVELGAKAPAVLLRNFNLLVRLQEIRQALPLAARILALVPDYDDYLFGSFSRWKMPIVMSWNSDYPAICGPCTPTRAFWPVRRMLSGSILCGPGCLRVFPRSQTGL